jgi:hypothetical protein
VAMSAKTKANDREGDARVLSWLLEEEQPAVRYRALVDLLDRKETDAEVRSTRARIGRAGWAYDQLRRQGPKGFWEPHEPKDLAHWVDFLYYPAYLATNWRALVLSDLGVDVSIPGIRKLADRVFEYKLRLSSPFNFYHEEACIAGNTARMLTRFGCAGDRRVRMLFDWLLEDQRADGGWNCSQGTPGTLDVWEPLAALAALPEGQRSSEMRQAISRGVEFYLRRQLFKEGPAYPPWLRFHYPNHYFYDVLLGLDLVTELGDASDRRLRPALRLLADKRRKDGTWLLDRAHPDVGPGVTIHPDPSKLKPLVIEAPGKPSKWITLKALRVLRRVESAG